MRTASSSSMAAGSRGRPVRAAVHDQGFRDLVADREHRIQRRHGLLEHERDVGAADLAQLFLRKRQQIAAPESHAASEDAAGRANEPEERESRERLAAPRLANEPHRLSRAHREADAVHDRRRHGAGREADREV